MNTRRIMHCASLVAALIGLRSTADAQFLVQHVSDAFPGMVETLPFNAPAPVAREMKYTYFYQHTLSGEPQPPILNTNESANGATGNPVPSIALPSPQAVVDLAAVYERKAADARGDGNSVMEQHYSRMSSYALESQIAAEQMNATVGLMQAGIAAGAALAAVAQEKAAQALAEWVAQTTGAVGPSAPEGTVLHLGFFEHFEAEEFSLQSHTSLVVTATLETPGEQQLAQGMSTTEVLTYRKRNPAAATPASGFAQYDETLKRTASDAVDARRLNRVPFPFHHAVVGHATVAALYEQLGEQSDAEQVP